MIKSLIKCRGQGHALFDKSGRVHEFVQGAAKRGTDWVDDWKSRVPMRSEPDWSRKVSSMIPGTPLASRFLPVSLLIMTRRPRHPAGRGNAAGQVRRSIGVITTS